MPDENLIEQLERLALRFELWAQLSVEAGEPFADNAEAQAFDMCAADLRNLIQSEGEQ